MNRVAKGQHWQSRAAEILKKKGFHILQENFSHWPLGEIDLIAELCVSKENILLVFIEVRYRQAGAAGALDFLSASKIQRITRTARRFLLRYQGPAREVRFDFFALGSRDWIHVEGAW